ncbi:Rne/Rng family ribonuclease [uncultured Phycicoccus sp.]|uniref:Rne/Rng family ribonuclease n=1 Tax=uncultured Phycicoccus sp. TaxID=661422 RepID=UPI00261D2602|nr:Rne/Rng family ribonuclease [uncultured Phycicoccus sp.]
MASENDTPTAEATAPATLPMDGSPADGDDSGGAAPRKRATRKRATKKAAAPAVDAPADGPADAADAAPAKKAGRSRKKAAAPVDAAEAPAEAVAAEDKPAKKTTRRKKAAAADVAPEAPAEEPADAEAEEEGQSAPAPAAAAGPGLGLLFQAPEPVAVPRRRRATSPAGAPVDPPAGQATERTERAERDERTERTDDEAPAATDAPSRGAGPEDDGDSADGEGGSRRRRRGGRGRRGRGKGEDDSETTDTADDKPASGRERGRRRSGKDSTDTGPDADQDSGSDDSDDESPSSRRRRRRRRGSSGGDSDDPPGTVTRVRTPRAERDEPTAVKGSTRLEAKKQRRREGREAGRRRTIITEAEFLARRESVERTMVVRARDGRTQIGVLEDNVLVEHYVSRETTASMAGNVYLGRVQNVLPSMEAAFVDIGKGRNAVLYAGEVNWDAAGLEVNQAKRIENALSSGDTVLVQVTKDPIGHKGARLTSQISLPGRYVVYVPEGSMTGISRKLPDTERARLKAILKEVVPEGAGVIVRTAAEGASEAELTADVERLTKQWERIQKKAESAKQKKSGSGGAPALLHGEPDLTIRVIRDVFTEDFASLVVSGEKAWSEVSEYVEDVAPDLAKRVTRWTSEDDVFAAHRIDEQIAKAMDRKVWLPSGGSLVIDRTEAMTVVDVNTGKFVGSGGNLEETVTKNNLEAAEEIVRQLRLRDIGGIIVIDFIDMVLESNRDLVVRRLLECLGRDRTKHQVAEVTSLGLVQMTRKRVGSGLIEVFSEPCEHCNGSGIVVHTEPIERGNGSGDSGSSRSGRGRRGGQGTPSAPAAEVPEHKPNGPTAAQIAAAAHAAALKHTEQSEVADQVAADVADQVAADVAAADPSAAAGEPAPAETAPAETAPAETAPAQAEPERQPEPAQVEATPQAEAEAEPVREQAVPEPERQPEPQPEPVPAARSRRRRGRVVAPAGPPPAAATGAPDSEAG